MNLNPLNFPMGNEHQTNAFNGNGENYTAPMAQTLAQFYLTPRPLPLPHNLPCAGLDAAASFGYPVPGLQGWPVGNPYMDPNSHITFVQEIRKILEGMLVHKQEMDALKTSMADISKAWKVFEEENSNKESLLREEVASIREALKRVEEEQQKECVKREETNNIINKNYEELRGAIKQLERNVYKNVEKNQQVSTEEIPPPPPPPSHPPKVNPPTLEQSKEVHVREENNINHDNSSSNDHVTVNSTKPFTWAQVVESAPKPKPQPPKLGLLNKIMLPTDNGYGASNPRGDRVSSNHGHVTRSKQADGRTHRAQGTTSPRHYYGNGNSQSGRRNSGSRSGGGRY